MTCTVTLSFGRKRWFGGPNLIKQCITKEKAIKVIRQFCIAHFYCAHLITYNFIHYTLYVPFKKKNHFMTILCYFKTSLVTFVQRITLKSMFSKKAYKSVARVLCLYFTFLCHNSLKRSVTPVF